MASPDGENGLSAGVSSPGDIDVTALFEELQEAVRARPPSARRAADGAHAHAARAAAERLWPVTVDRPVERRPGPRGAALYPVKHVLRRLIRWYVEPFAAEQRGFNDATLKLIDALSERADAAAAGIAGLRTALDEALHRLEGRLGATDRLLHEVEHRVLRLERRERTADGSPTLPAATLAAQPAAAAIPDYFAFEARMRASPEEIRDRQRIYVDDFRDAAPVLDVGCGRGEFLRLLGEAGVEAKGVEAAADMVAYARGEGLDVAHADALEHLSGLEDGSLGGIFAAQVVEHLPAPVLVRLLELAAAKLRPGGVLVAETINPLTLSALRHYFADLTHAQPLVPDTLSLLGRQAGFRTVDVRFLNEPPPEERLRAVELPPGPAYEDARTALADNVRLLNEHLFGPLDYAIVART